MITTILMYWDTLYLSNGSDKIVKEEKKIFKLFKRHPKKFQEWCSVRNISNTEEDLKNWEIIMKG